MRSALTSWLGPVTDSAAATPPSGPKMGAATQLTPMLPSSRSIAQPRSGTAVSSRTMATGLVSVRGVRECSGPARAALMTGGSEYASMARPSAEQYAGIMPPTWESIGMARCPVIFSTTSTWVPSSTPSCTVIFVAWCRSCRNGSTASRSSSRIGARLAISNRRLPMRYRSPGFSSQPSWIILIAVRWVVERGSPHRVTSAARVSSRWAASNAARIAAARSRPPSAGALSRWVGLTVGSAGS